MIINRFIQGTLKTLSLIFTLSCFLHLSASAQVKSISGTVTDGTNNEPIPGVSIAAKENPGLGTITDVNGNYSLAVPVEVTTLVFSFIGMLTEEIVIGDKKRDIKT